MIAIRPWDGIRNTEIPSVKLEDCQPPEISPAHQSARVGPGCISGDNPTDAFAIEPVSLLLVQSLTALAGDIWCLPRLHWTFTMLEIQNSYFAGT